MTARHGTRLAGLLTLGLLAALPPAQVLAQAACPDPIPIGLTTVLTTDVALLGVQPRNALQYAVEEVNAAGGIAGKKVKLSVEDTGGSAATALNALNRILEDKPLVVYGSMISPHVFTQTEVIKKAELPFIVAATNARITDQGVNWLFRVHVHDGQLAELIPAYVAKEMKKTKPAILAVADDFGLGATKGMQASFTKLGITPVAAESYPPNDKDMTAQLLGIKDKGADSLIVFGRPGEVTIILKQMKQLAIELPVIGNASIVTPTMLNNVTAAEADGTLAIGGIIPQGRSEPKVVAWTKAVGDKFKVPPDNFAVAYYDSFYLLKSIIEKVGCDKAAIRAALAETKDWPGMIIKYTADAKGDLAHQLGAYRNKGKTPEFVGVVNEPGF